MNDLLVDRPRSSWDFAGRLEVLAVCFLGTMVMQFIYLDPRGYRDERVGAPGYDSFYHVKMAALMPEIGLPDEFPWLRFVYFTREGQRFVSHHYGFHVLLVPFVRVADWLTGDALRGGRWAISVFFGISLGLIHLLLRRALPRGAWAWLLLLLLFPSDFFLRHSYIRAIAPALMGMLAITLLLFQRRYLWAGIAVGLYNHLYLGAVMYGPLLVIAYVASSALGPRGDREIPWRAVLFTFSGWLLGVLTYPYHAGMWEFLTLQVFGTGLTPDIEVGMEWQPYQNVWSFAAEQGGVLLLVWTGALCLRVRRGPVLSREDLTLLMLHFLFLLLTLKARRFIEYWPVWALLSAGYLAAPVLEDVRRAAAARLDRLRSKAWIGLAGAVLGGALVGAWAWRRGSDFQNGPALAEWPVWGLTALLFLVAAQSRLWRRSTLSGSSRFAIFPLGSIAPAVVLFVVLVYALWNFGFQTPLRQPPRLIGWTWAVGVGVALVALSHVLKRSRPAAPKARDASSSPWVNGLTGPFVGVAVLGVTLLVAAVPLVRAQRQSYCGYDLPAARNVMNRLMEASEPGDVVFTDDWDVFPLYFYFNSHNHYIVGLDPKFTQAREPELWERYVKITRGEAPCQGTVRLAAGQGEWNYHSFDVRLEDIRDRFGARFVLVDRDHRNLARQLARRPELAELIYPSSDFEASKDAPYLLFQIHESTEPPFAPSPTQLTEDSRRPLKSGAAPIVRRRATPLSSTP